MPVKVTLIFTNLFQASNVTIELFLSNNESRQLSVDNETPVSGLLDIICNEEKLNPSFYAIYYVTPANTPVPVSRKMTNLESLQLRLVDKRGNNFILNICS